MNPYVGVRLSCHRGGRRHKPRTFVPDFAMVPRRRERRENALQNLSSASDALEMISRRKISLLAVERVCEGAKRDFSESRRE